jgi:hypothetical protein
VADNEQQDNRSWQERLSDAADQGESDYWQSVADQINENTQADLRNKGYGQDEDQ